ncbi:MAG TPA: hypothetical protein VM925_09975 [Labilithrix sp.]|nr:hypothetical protein [Labilithrix sp.]
MSGEREERDREPPHGSSVARGPQTSSADLLDLVRAAEDEARLAMGAVQVDHSHEGPAAKPPASALRGVEREEEFVDVGDDAVDAPPSEPSPRASGSLPPATKSSRPPRALSGPEAVAPSAKRAEIASLPPAVAIAVMLALAIAALVIVTR